MNRQPVGVWSWHHRATRSRSSTGTLGKPAPPDQGLGERMIGDEPGAGKASPACQARDHPGHSQREGPPALIPGPGSDSGNGLTDGPCPQTQEKNAMPSLGIVLGKKSDSPDQGDAPDWDHEPAGDAGDEQRKDNQFRSSGDHERPVTRQAQSQDDRSRAVSRTAALPER